MIGVGASRLDSRRIRSGPVIGILRISRRTPDGSNSVCRHLHITIPHDSRKAAHVKPTPWASCRCVGVAWDRIKTRGRRRPAWRQRAASPRGSPTSATARCRVRWTPRGRRRPRESGTGREAGDAFSAPEGEALQPAAHGGLHPVSATPHERRCLRHPCVWVSVRDTNSDAGVRWLQAFVLHHRRSRGTGEESLQFVWGESVKGRGV